VNAQASPWDYVSPPITCAPYTALLTPEGCRANRRAAHNALKCLQTGRELPWEVPLPALDRLITCGRCPRGAELQPVTTEWILRLIEQCLDRLEVYAHQLGDPEAQRENRRTYQREWAAEKRSRMSKTKPDVETEDYDGTDGQVF